MFKKHLIAGLLVWVPVVITIWVLTAIVQTMDGWLRAWVPTGWMPSWAGHEIPGFGVIVTLIGLLLTGFAASNFFGRHLLGFWDRVVSRIPVVKTVYSGVKQVSDTLLAPNGQAFRKAVLVPYPHAGSWTIAFLTGQPGGDAANHLVGDYVSVYVPTTPNPTSGFFLMMQRTDVVELNMSVDEALKYVISMGVVAPEIGTKQP
mgnify:CR=1 FL=1